MMMGPITYDVPTSLNLQNHATFLTPTTKASPLWTSYMNAPSLGAADEGDVERTLVDVVKLVGAREHLRFIDAVRIQRLNYLGGGKDGGR